MVFERSTILVCRLGLSGQTHLAKDITNKITLSTYFRVRNYLDMGPKIDEKFAVYAFDDSSVFRLNRPSLTMLEDQYHKRMIAKNLK